MNPLKQQDTGGRSSPRLHTERQDSEKTFNLLKSARPRAGGVAVSPARPRGLALLAPAHTVLAPASACRPTAMQGLRGHEAYLSRHLDSPLLFSKWYRTGVSPFPPKGSASTSPPRGVPTVSVAIAQLLCSCFCRQYANDECGWVPRKLSSQKEAGLGPGALVPGPGMWRLENMASGSGRTGFNPASTTDRTCGLQGAPRYHHVKWG